MGMNIQFVGGASPNLGFAFDSRFLDLFGKYYITRIDEPSRPSNLIVFLSARADRQVLGELGAPRGYFRVRAPTDGTPWADRYDPDTQFPGNNSGFVDLRYFNKAVVALFDGHAQALGWDDLHDMRRWSDRADSPDWTLRP